MSGIEIDRVERRNGASGLSSIIERGSAELPSDAPQQKKDVANLQVGIKGAGRFVAGNPSYMPQPLGTGSCQV